MIRPLSVFWMLFFSAALLGAPVIAQESDSNHAATEPEQAGMEQEQDGHQDASVKSESSHAADAPGSEEVPGSEEAPGSEELSAMHHEADAQPKLNEHLQPLAPFVGKTWRGEFADSTPEKPKFDVQQWESILKGQAVRIMHSVNDGEYGGETIVVWDAEKEAIVYYYFTTAGFFTTGEFDLEAGSFSSLEAVTGNQNGVTEVKSIGEITEDGLFVSRAEYKVNGEWHPGHSVTYVEAPEARVRFDG
ncbi:MAG: hypothetical protein AAGN46_03105 [Acidobacteriota bacterium]